MLIFLIVNFLDRLLFDVVKQTGSKTSTLNEKWMFLNCLIRCEFLTRNPNLYASSLFIECYEILDSEVFEMLLSGLCKWGIYPILVESWID